MHNSAWLTSIDLLSDTLSELITVSGVTGQEDAVADKIIEMLSPLPLEIKRDPLGNLIAVLNPGPALKLLFCIWMKSAVEKIDRRFLHLYPLGGVPETACGCGFG